MISEKILSGTIPYLEDILHPTRVPEGDHDNCNHLHQKIYNTWDEVEKSWFILSDSSPYIESNIKYI